MKAPESIEDFLALPLHEGEAELVKEGSVWMLRDNHARKSFHLCKVNGEYKRKEIIDAQSLFSRTLRQGNWTEAKRSVNEQRKSTP